MTRFFLILNLLWIAVFTSAYSQTLKLLLDTAIQADLIQLDPLGNIYVLRQSDKTLLKYDVNFKLLHQTTLQNNWNEVALDVSDPFKLILYYPGDFQMSLFDAQLHLIQTLYEPELSENTRICHFDSERLILYDGNKLYIKNYHTQQIENSIYSGLNLPVKGRDVSILKFQDKIYFICRYVGIQSFTTQLFEHDHWKDPDLETASLNSKSIYKIKNNKIFGFSQKTGIETELYSGINRIRQLSTSHDKVAILEGGRLKLFN
ncbi:MAG: hypothetical protein IPM34_02900 [Saprospiraceae bacterium]|nr:hypothetical protein [Saprospiraceae bacterium]